jgi:hypothetical protein
LVACLLRAVTGDIRLLGAREEVVLGDNVIDRGGSAPDRRWLVVAGIPGVLSLRSDE